MEGFKPYTDSKDTGQPWLGKVPGHWRALPNRAVFNEVKSQGHENEPMLSVTITRGIVKQSDLLSETAKKDSSNLDRSKYKLVEPGDIAYNKMRAWQGAFGASAYRGIVSPAYVVQRLRGEGVPEFFHHLFRTPTFAKEAERWSYGITSDMWSLRPEHFKAIYVPVPPPAEQSAIVRFLSALDRRVNRFVRAKRRLIELLTEQKQALITHAVTRGLNPNAKRKPSGIAWLGDVPEHWEVLDLRRVLTPGRRITYGIVQPGLPDASGRFMVRGKDYSFGWATPNEIFRVSDAIEGAYQRSRLRRNDIVITIVGAGVGNVALVPDWLSGANITQTTARISVEQGKANAEYVLAVLQSAVGKRNLERFVYGSAQPRMNLPHVAAYTITVPPLQEQTAIVAHVNERTKGFEAATLRALDEIALLREYRTRLVADVVTGKLDVRAAAAKLPDEDAGAAESIDAAEDTLDSEGEVEEFGEEVTVGADDAEL